MTILYLKPDQNKIYALLIVSKDLVAVTIIMTALGAFQNYGRYFVILRKINLNLDCFLHRSRCPFPIMDSVSIKGN